MWRPIESYWLRRVSRYRADAGGPMGLVVAAFYRFAALAEEELAPWRQRLVELGQSAGVKGTVLLAPEGVNGTVCGPAPGVEALLAELRSDPRLAKLEVKTAVAPQQTFYRLKVRLKREIVSMGCPTVKPYVGKGELESVAVGTHVPPEQWDALIADPDTLVIDTRNDYEVALGSFAGAIDPGTASFREFPQWVETELRPLVEQRQPKQIAMFCTGGIRCSRVLPGSTISRAAFCATWKPCRNRPVVGPGSASSSTSGSRSTTSSNPEKRACAMPAANPSLPLIAKSPAMSRG